MTFSSVAIVQYAHQSELTIPDCYRSMKKLQFLCCRKPLTKFLPFVKDTEYYQTKPKTSSRVSASPAATNGPNVPLICSHLQKFQSCILLPTADRFQTWKQWWNSAVTITAFSDLPRETQQALFKILHDETVKKWPSKGSKMSMISLNLSKPRYVVAQVSLFMNTSFRTGYKGKMSVFKNLNWFSDPTE